MNPYRILYFNRENHPHNIADILTQLVDMDEAVGTGQNTEAYDAIMVHGASRLSSPIRTDDELRNWLYGEKGLLLLSPDAETMNAIRAHIGLGTKALPLACFIQRDGPTQFRIFELDAGSGTAKRTRYRAIAIEDELREDPDARTEEIIEFEDDLPEQAWSPFLLDILGYAATKKYGDGSANEEIPEDIKKWTFVITKSRICCHFEGDRTQCWTANVNYHVSLFLNNPVEGEQYQYIYVRQESLVNPGTLLCNAANDRHWFQDRFDTSMEITDPDIFLDQSSPKNTIQEVEVTDSVNFKISYEIASSPKQTGTYEYGHSETRKIGDWQVVEYSAGKKGAWTYAQVLPYDAVTNNYLGGFAWVAPPLLIWRVQDLPNLSTASLQTDTQAVWRTAKVMDKKITLKSEVSGRTVYLSTGPIYMSIWYDVTETPKYEIDFEIDLGKVVEKEKMMA